MDVRGILASLTSEEYADDLLSSEKIQQARQNIEDAVLDSKLEELLEAGVDECTVCGEEVDIEGAESWDDIHTILEEHAHERADHVHIPGEGWILRSEE